MARNDPQINLRIPEDLKEALDASALREKRSLTAEVVARLALSISRDPEIQPELIARRRVVSKQLLDRRIQLAGMEEILKAREARLVPTVMANASEIYQKSLLEPEREAARLIHELGVEIQVLQERLARIDAQISSRVTD